MAGFNQLLLAGNPWPIGAITHLLTEAQGNYKLLKYTHDPGALDCMVLMDLGQETVVCSYISQFPPLPKPFHISRLPKTAAQIKKLWCVEAVSSPPKTQTSGFSLPLNPLQPLRIINTRPDFSKCIMPSSVVLQTSYRN